MPFVQRAIEPKFLSKTSLWTEDGKPKIEDHELEAVTNNTLSNALRQLASLLLVAEDIFSVLGDQLKEINRRSENLKTRIAKVDKKVIAFDPKTVSVRLFICIIEGCGMAWSSPILKKLNDTEDNPLGRPITTDESSLLASLPIVGSIIASFILMILTKKLGRKPILVMHGCASLICFLTLAFSANIWFYYLARFISGFNSAAMVVLVPMYICEIADSSTRGSLASGMIVSINIGILTSFSVGPFLSFIWFHSCLAILPIIYMILFSLFGLESPYYYLKSDPSRAKDLLQTLRGVDDVTDTLNEMIRCHEETSEENFLNQMKTRGAKKALLLGIIFVILNDLVGANVVMTYAQFIIDSAGATWTGEVDNIVVGTVQLIVSMLAVPIMDKFQRKHLMSVSTILLGIFMAFLSLYLILKDEGFNVGNFGWAPLLCFLGYVSSYNMGLGPLWNTVLGELFPQGIKNTAMSLCNLVYSVVIFLLTFAFQRVKQNIGLGETLMFFSAMAILLTIFIMIFLVETRGKTLEEIQNEMKSGNLKT